MPGDGWRFLFCYSALKKDQLTKGAGLWLVELIMSEFSFSTDQTWVREGTGNWSQWGTWHGSIESVWVWSLLAEPLSGFLHILKGPAPSRHHMDHLNGLSTQSLDLDVESEDKQCCGKSPNNNIKVWRAQKSKAEKKERWYPLNWQLTFFSTHLKLYPQSV